MHRRYLLFLVTASLLLGLVWVAPTTASAQNVIVQAAKGKIKRPTMVLPNGVRKQAPGFSSGTLAAATPVVSGLDDPNGRADNTADPGAAKAGVTIHTAGCSDPGPGSNVRANPGCRI